MARWQKREDFLPVQTGVYASTLRWEITREFPIEAILLRLRVNLVSMTGTTPTATVTPVDGIWALIKRIQITVADGARTRNVMDISGPELADYVRQVAGGLPSGDYLGGNQFANPSGLGYQAELPIYFAMPNLSDPISSCTMLPAPRYNSNIILSITCADSQASVYILGGGGTPALTEDFSITPHIIRRDVRDPNWVYLDWELASQTLTLAVNRTNQMFELQIPGSYTGILLRGFNSLQTNLSTTGRGDPSAKTAGGSSTVTVGEFSLRLLGNVIRRFNWGAAQSQNEMSMMQVGYNQAVSPLTVCRFGASAPSIYLDFINDKAGQEADHLGSVLDTNPLMATGARLQFYADCLATTGTQSIGMVTHRIFGDLSQFKPSNTPGA